MTHKNFIVKICYYMCCVIFAIAESVLKKKVNIDDPKQYNHWVNIDLAHLYYYHDTKFILEVANCEEEIIRCHPLTHDCSHKS